MAKADNLLEKAIQEVEMRKHFEEIEEYRDEYMDALKSKDYLANDDDIRDLASVLAEVKLAYNENDKLTIEAWQVAILKDFIENMLYT